MAYNGSGTFNRIHSWADDAANSVNISSTRMDDEMDGMATALSSVLVRDGQAAMTGDLDLNANLIVLDADADTKIGAASDDIVSLDVGAVTGIMIADSSYIRGVGAARLTKGHCSVILTHGADADHDISFSAGVAIATDNATVMVTKNAQVKQIDAAWAEGDAAGGLDTGTVAASTMYHCWRIYESTTATVDHCFAITSSAAATVLANIQALAGGADYDKAQLVGAVKTDGSANILAMEQHGDYFRYVATILDVNDTTITDDVYETATVSVPPHCEGQFLALAANTSSTETLFRFDVKDPSDTRSFAAGQTAFVLSMSSATITRIGGVVWEKCNNLGQISYAADETAATTTTVQLRTIGFRMITRGQGT